jgi:hypothetical protein
MVYFEVSKLYNLNTLIIKMYFSIYIYIYMGKVLLIVNLHIVE